MAHLDAYIEKCPGFAWEGAPQWNTLVTPLRNKRSRRNSQWSQPLWRFTVPFNANFPEHYDQVVDMFMACRGRKHFFRVRNWLRHKADGWVFAIGDGVTQEFQLGKLITVDSQSVLTEVHALSLEDDAPAPVALVNDVVESGVTFNDRIGKVRFDTPPVNGAVLSWSGWFDHWVAFASDDFPASIDNKSDGKFITTFVAELEEVEPPDEDFESSSSS